MNCQPDKAVLSLADNMATDFLQKLVRQGEIPRLARLTNAKPMSSKPISVSLKPPLVTQAPSTRGMLTFTRNI